MTEEHQIKIKKFLVCIIAITIIILLLTYITIDIGMLNQLTASKIINNKTKFKDLTIEFTNNTYKQILNIYLDQQPNEIKLCLLGTIKDKTYTITKIIQPKIIHQEFSKVESIPCPKQTIIDLHSHPRKSCIFSQQDIKSYNINKQNNPNLLMAVLCDHNKINFYQESFSQF